MSLAAVQEEVETWPPEDQDRLATHVALLRLKRSGHIEEMSRRLDDDQPGAWLPFAEIKRKLGERRRLLRA